MVESVFMVEDDEAIVALMARLEELIETVIDRKFTDRDEKLEALAKTLDQTHKLVNSRMSQLTAALEKAAALASVLAGEEGEERGAANERKRAAQHGDG